ncbi:hypothetical protein LSAT2_023058 [Lamellibrachia satsuma]|nr:hypothetical protein LSAT2_023058 [Lamellibrachia satsuma]
MIAIGSRYWTVGCTVIYMLCLGVNETAGSYCDTHYCGPFEPDFLLEQVAKPITTQNSASVEKCKYIVKQNDDIISSLKQHDGRT